jgi:hypothetical protein
MKVKRSKQRTFGQHHRINSEDDDNRIFSKDRWPIPLSSTKFLNVNLELREHTLWKHLPNTNNIL